MPRKGARVALPKRTTGNFATATEQFSIGATAGVVYDFKFNMNDLSRTKALLGVYQYYRITSVEMRFKPAYDTYQAQQANMVPYLYFQYDKSGALQGTMTAVDFEKIGTKAIRLDDKTIVRKWTPSVPTDQYPGGVLVSSTQFKTAPWVPTIVPDTGNPNDLLDHYGATFYISKMSPGDVLGYDIDVVVNVQFRKPLVVPGSSERTPINPPRIIQGNQSGIDLSLNPTLQH